jgi:hypothetical protein
VGSRGGSGGARAVFTSTVIAGPVPAAVEVAVDAEGDGVEFARAVVVGVWALAMLWTAELACGPLLLLHGCLLLLVFRPAHLCLCCCPGLVFVLLRNGVAVKVFSGG